MKCVYLLKYQATYKPKKELSLDEGILVFRGRLSFRTYMKNKKRSMALSSTSFVAVTVTFSTSKFIEVKDKH